MLSEMDIARRRMAGQKLVASTFTIPLEVVEWLAAVQAQDYPGAKWAIAQRANGVTDATIDRALADGTIVRTHVLRPTWHLVAATDIRWMLELTGPRVNKLMAPYDRLLELDEAVFRKSNAAIAKALRDGKHLTRAEIRQVLERAKLGAISTQRLGHLLMRAELDRVICSGGMRGRKSTHALFDERVPPAAPLDRDEALTRIARRYFASRGPASAQDLAWWSGLTVADARRAIESAAGELEEESFGNRPLWFVDDGQPVPSTRGRAWLVPNYDESFIGYRDRGAMGRRIRDGKVMERDSVLAAHIAIADSQIVGGWKRQLGRKSVKVDLTLLARLTKEEGKSLKAQAERYGAFVGQPATLEVSQGGAPPRSDNPTSFRAKVLRR